MVIALDSNVFIAALSSNEEHSPNAQKLIRSINEGKHSSLASSIVYGEVFSVSVVGQSLDLEDFFSHIDNLVTIPASDSICVQAGRLRIEHGSKLKLPDAIHLATALDGSSDLFVTNDVVLAKIAKELIPTKLLSEWL